MRRPQQIVAAFALGCLGECVDDERGQHHRAVAVRLQRADDDRAVHHDGVAVQLDTAPQEIHVVHSQCGGFTPPKATDAQQQNKRSVAPGLDGELVQLRGRQVNVAPAETLVQFP